jgi:hypothetical protein
LVLLTTDHLSALSGWHDTLTHRLQIINSVHFCFKLQSTPKYQTEYLGAVRPGARAKPTSGEHSRGGTVDVNGCSMRYHHQRGQNKRQGKEQGTGSHFEVSAANNRLRLAPLCPTLVLPAHPAKTFRTSMSDNQLNSKKQPC